MDQIAARIANMARTTASGEWQRHVAGTYASKALDGRTADGRWGTRSGFPVLYLGRPTESVVVEAYRHLVDPVIFEDQASEDEFLRSLAPRALITCHLEGIPNLLDLRSAGARNDVGLTIQDLTAPVHDKEAYRRCQHVAHVAHQLRLYGVLAPAATAMGQTLALFMDILPPTSRPVESRPAQSWARLPGDPRKLPRPHLRAVKTP